MTNLATDWPHVESDMNAWIEWAREDYVMNSFMLSWYLTNAVRKAHGLPELLYGDVRERW